MPLWKTFCERRRRHQVTHIEQRSREDLRSHSDYSEMEGVPFYSVHLEDNQSLSWAPTFQPPNEELRGVLEGEKYYNSCFMACMVCYPVVVALFEDDNYITGVEWRTAFPQPEFVIFHTGKHVHYIETGHQEEVEQTLFRHDVLVLQSRTGKEYVIDVSGRQFGFTRWFYTWEEYLQHIEVRSPQGERDPDTLFANILNAVGEDEADAWEHEAVFLKAFAEDLFSSVQRELESRGRPLSQLPEQEMGSAHEAIVKLFEEGLRHVEQCESSYPAYMEWAPGYRKHVARMWEDMFAAFERRVPF